MAHYGDDVELGDINPTVYRDLLTELNKNSAWRTLATYVIEKYRRIDYGWLDRLEQKVSPAADLLNELEARGWRIEDLCDALRACELLDALYILAGQETSIRLCTFHLDDTPKFVTTEDLVITQQPSPDGKPYKVRIGHIFSIKCKAKGLPPPKYQWLFENEEIPNQTSSTLNLLIKRFEQEGDYYCMVSHYNRDNELVAEVLSGPASLTIEPTPVKICKSLKSEYKFELGQELILSCEAEGHPIPQYQWFKGKKLIGNSNTLRIPNFSHKDTGEYRCDALNGHYKDSAVTQVEVGYPPQTIRSKVALLIGNSKYDHDGHLPLATADVKLIGGKLKKLGFHIMCCQNLNRREMMNAIDSFCYILESDCYGLFYYAGHGFKAEARCMKPVDAPKNYSQACNISEEELIRRCFYKKSKLFIAIFDMCLTEPPEELNPKDDKPNESEKSKESEKSNEFKETKKAYPDQWTIAYSTSDYNPCYELAEATHGVYASHLSKHLMRNIPFHEVYHVFVLPFITAIRASKDSRVQEQIPMQMSALKEPPLYLTDKVIRPISGVLQYTRNKLTKTLTRFAPTTVPLTFKEYNLSCQVTVQLPTLYLNVIEISISDLENFYVTFESDCETKAELHPEGKKCMVYNAQRMGSLKIGISKNGNRPTYEDFVCRNRGINLLPENLLYIFSLIESPQMIQNMVIDYKNLFNDLKNSICDSAKPKSSEV